MHADDLLQKMITSNDSLIYEFIDNNFTNQIYELTNFHMDEPFRIIIHYNPNNNTFNIEFDVIQRLFQPARSADSVAGYINQYQKLSENMIDGYDVLRFIYAFLGLGVIPEMVLNVPYLRRY